MFHRSAARFKDDVSADVDTVGNVVIGGERDAQAFFATCFAANDPGIETLIVAHLDGGGRCVHVAQYEGNEQSAEMPMRDIVRDALTHSTAALIIAHNHPSGDASPSASDCRATARLARVAEAIDLTVVDHLIFSGDDWRSFRRMGLL